MFEVFSKCVEARLPEQPHLLEPGDGGVDRLRVDVAAMHAAIAFADEKSGIFEHAHMFRDRGQRHVKRFGQLADRVFAGRELRQHGAACGVGEGGECGVEGWTVNHVVNYYARAAICQMARDL